MAAIRNLVLGFIIAHLFTGAVAAEAITLLHPDGPYTQASSGMTYPVAIGDFKRVSVIRYKEDGTDESAGYNREVPMQEISATVYVFPSPGLISIFSPQNVIDGARDHLCNSQFLAIQKEITNAHPDAALVSQGDSTLEQEYPAYGGHQAFYTLTNASFAGRSQIALRSDVYVFCYAGGKWTVEYRIDYPADYDASAPIASFMRDLTWTIPPKKK
jgi:hypothetical protein